MDRERTRRLSDVQLACLRLVADGLTSKEIAPRLGISHHTVDAHLKEAMRALGASSRREAARKSGLPEYQPLVGAAYQALEIAPPAEEGFILSLRNALRTFGWPLRKGRRGNDLNTRQRLVWIVLIMLFAATACAVGVNFLVSVVAFSRAVAVPR